MIVKKRHFAALNFCRLPGISLCSTGAPNNFKTVFSNKTTASSIFFTNIHCENTLCSHQFVENVWVVTHHSSAGELSSLYCSTEAIVICLGRAIILNKQYCSTESRCHFSWASHHPEQTILDRLTVSRMTYEKVAGALQGSVYVSLVVSWMSRSPTTSCAYRPGPASQREV